MNFNSLRATAILHCFMLAAGCTSGLSCSRPAQADPLYVVDHILGGEAPLAERVEVYPDGRALLSIVGGGRSCARLSSAQLYDLGITVASLEEFASRQNLGVDWQEVWISSGTERFGIAVDDRRPELLFSLEELDQIFELALGRDYIRIVEFLGSSEP